MKTATEMNALAYELVRCLKGLTTGSIHDFGHRVWTHAQKMGLIDADGRVVSG